MVLVGSGSAGMAGINASFNFMDMFNCCFRFSDPIQPVLENIHGGGQFFFNLDQGHCGVGWRTLHASTDKLPNNFNVHAAPGKRLPNNTLKGLKNFKQHTQSTSIRRLSSGIGLEAVTNFYAA